MRRDDVRFAAAARDDGIRRVSKYTWRAGAVGIACSAVIAVAFGHHVAIQQPSTVQGGTGNSGGSTSGGSTSRDGSTNTGTSGGSTGRGGSTNTGSGGGGSSSTGSGGSSSTGSGGNQGQGGTIVVPAQPPAPASGGGQVTSGAS